MMVSKRAREIMCFSKENLLIWINHEWFDGKVMLRLMTTPDGRRYNDYFTIERVIGGGTGTEVVFTIPFRDIKEMGYTTSSASSGEPCTISFDIDGGEECLREIKVDRHCFNYFTVRKMVRLVEKSKKAALL